MITLISATNRPGNRTQHIVAFLQEATKAQKVECEVLDLQKLPPELMQPESYASKPSGFQPFQDAILKSDGIIMVLPEYNGSYPGIAKYFIDMLQFPESLSGVPSAFVGLAAGRWGGLRGVEQMQTIFQYRKAHLFGERVFLPAIPTLLDESSKLIDPDARQRLLHFLEGFFSFVEKFQG